METLREFESHPLRNYEKMSKEKSPVVIPYNENEPHLALGRHFGLKMHGRQYKFYEKEHSFIREDMVKEYEKSKNWQEFIDKVST